MNRFSQLFTAPKIYTYEQWAKDLHTLIHYGTLGLHDIHLVGFSMGGAVVMKYMSTYTPALSVVKKVTLVSAAGPNMGWHMQRQVSSPTSLRLEELCAGLLTYAGLVWADQKDVFDVLVEWTFPYIDCNATIDGGEKIRSWLEDMFNSIHKDAIIGACLEMQKDNLDLMNSVTKITTPTKICSMSMPRDL